jgi:NAD(P)-dependent dehydrogenase (short-subunit alcohol dehydrogenase family)
LRRWSRLHGDVGDAIDVLHYNVGVSIGGGDAPLAEITEDAFDRLATINLSSTSIERQLRGVATTPIGQRRRNEEEAKWTRLSSA